MGVWKEIAGAEEESDVSACLFGIGMALRGVGGFIFRRHRGQLYESLDESKALYTFACTAKSGSPHNIGPSLLVFRVSN